MSKNANAHLLVATALNVDAESLPSDAAPGETSGWDSLAHMRLVTAIEEQLGHRLKPMDIVSIGSVDDVAKLLP